MLTVKAPLEIKAKNTYLTASESFCQGIIGNYSMMDVSVSGEDLMHLSATPPEIYVTEGEGMTSVLSHNERNEINLKKVDILNNIINRIIVSADAHLTYQDRVFITDALYKLGIRDDRKFMKAFYRMSEETRNTNTLIDLYLERGGELRSLIENAEFYRERESETQTERVEREKENYLYKEVMDRLQTGAVYQIVSNFNRSVGDTNIDSREYSIASQTYTAQHILLSMLRQNAGVGEDSIFYFGNNIYEEGLEAGDTEVTNIKNELTGAVFMDMLQNIYHTGFDRFSTTKNAFYSFEDTFFKASDLTFQRLIDQSGEANYYSSENETFLTENNRLTNNEIELLEGNKEGQISEDELIRITETINEINVRNEKRRQEYVKAVEQIRSRERSTPAESGMQKTLRDGPLALSSPEALRARLEEEDARAEIKEKRVIEELKTVFPDSTAEIFNLINEYRENPQEFIQNNIIRPADVGELLYDINTVTREAEEERNRPLERAARSEEFIKAIDEARQSEGSIRAERERKAAEPVTRIHKSSETITEEDLAEQLTQMQSNISKQVKKDVREEVHIENRSVSTNETRTNENVSSQIQDYDIERMIENGVKREMSAISNEVMNKIERQMRNEKMRRGY